MKHQRWKEKHASGFRSPVYRKSVSLLSVKLVLILKTVTS